MSLTNIARSYSAKKFSNLLSKTLPDFKAGDTISVFMRNTDSKTDSLVVFTGLCIAKKNNGVLSRCIVRKISSDIGVERSILIYSPLVQSISVLRRGKVRRSKLYYIRNLSGKKARIKESKKAI